MPEYSVSRRIRAGVLLVAFCTIAGASLGGCSAVGSWLEGTESEATIADSDQASSTNASGDDGVDEMLTMMEQLADGDDTTQTAMFSSARDALIRTPSTRNRLKYALALSVPGHGGSNIPDAAEELRALLQSRQLLPRQRMLATIQLQSIDQLLELQAQADQVNSALQNARTAQLEADMELQELRSARVRLEADLEDATAKLDAITSIEQSINEREDDEN